MIAQSIADLDFDRVKQAVKDRTRTTLGQRSVGDMAVYSTRSEVLAQLELTTEMRDLLESDHKAPFGGILDVHELLEHAQKRSVLESSELIDIAGTVRGIWMLIRFFDQQRTTAPNLALIAQTLPDLGELHQSLYDTFDQDGNVADEASEHLAQLRKRSRSLHNRIRARLKHMLGDIVMQEHLQDQYFTIRDYRYVLPVVSGDKNEVKGIVHGSSQSGQTLFIEPAELVPINNDLKICEQDVLLEERRILQERTEWIAMASQDIRSGMSTIATLDLIYARARLSMAMSAHPPLISRNNQVHLVEAKNPLLVLRGIDVVPNTIKLGVDWAMLIVTGPNAGGKTVTLSTLGLFALMVRSGLHLPASPETTIPVFRNVLAVSGDNQDIQSDLSTFSGHLRRLISVLNEAEASSLVLIDEAAVGTEPEQGAALATAVLEALVARGAVGVVTTHYKQLKMLSLSDNRFQNASVGTHENSQEPNYILTLGTPGASSPIDLAARMGLPASIIARAQTLLADPGQTVEKTLQKLNEDRARLADELDTVGTLRSQLEERLRQKELALKRITERGEELAHEARSDALEAIQSIRTKLGEIVRSLQKDPTQKTVHTRRAQLKKHEQELKSIQVSPPEPVVDELPPLLTRKELETGVKVYVPALAKDGVITEVRGNNIVVQVGSIHTTVSAKTLRHPKVTPEPQDTPPARLVVEEINDELPPKTADTTVDVRGENVQDALAKVERFMDNAILKNRAVIYVVHGHGTGRLKKGLREEFGASQYIFRFEPAPRDKGGDGVTVVWLS